VVATAPELVLLDQAGVASLPVEVTNQTDAAVREVTVRVELPDGTASPEVVELGELAAGERRTVQFGLDFPGEVTARDTRVEVTVAWTAAGQATREATTTRQLRLTCAETPTSPAAVSFVDSEETAGEDGAAVNAIDGNPGTIWHTQWQGGSPEHPHEIQLDLGQVMDVCALHYLPRQDSNLNGTVADYEIYLSEDGESWGDPVASGTFAAGSDEKWVPFAGTSARYVRVVARSEVNGGPWTSAAELSLDALPG
jgi:hexosaminidase